MNDIKVTEQKCVQCGANFVLNTEILFKLRKIDQMMHGSNAWWDQYQTTCENCFKRSYKGVITPDITIIDKIEKKPEYKKWLKDFGILSIAQLKEMGKQCKTVK